MNYSPVADPLTQALAQYGSAGYSPAVDVNQSIMPDPVAQAMPQTDFMSMEGAFGNPTTGTNGWAPTAVNAFGSLANAWLGMKQYGLAKDNFKESKRQFNLNYGAQKTLTNSRLRDRQRARVASNPGAYVSVGDYMKQNEVK